MESGELGTFFAYYYSTTTPTATQGSSEMPQDKGERLSLGWMLLISHLSVSLSPVLFPYFPYCYYYYTTLVIHRLGLAAG